MIRRDFFKNSLAMAALAAGTGTDPLSAAPASPEPQPPGTAPFPKAPGLTKYVSEFIVNAKYTDIPPTCWNWAGNRSSTALAWRSPGRRP